MGKSPFLPLFSTWDTDLRIWGKHLKNPSCTQKKDWKCRCQRQVLCWWALDSFRKLWILKIWLRSKLAQGHNHVSARRKMYARIPNLCVKTMPNYAIHTQRDRILYSTHCCNMQLLQALLLSPQSPLQIWETYIHKSITCNLHTWSSARAHTHACMQPKAPLHG